ncbi:MAG: L,D-transpeptidase family protein [Marinobacter sp.]
MSGGASPALIATRWGAWLDGLWLPCAIGRGGMTDDKREGDGASPRGFHRATGLLYRADRVARPAPWAQAIGPGDLWSDDLRDPDYNHAVRAPHGYGHERLHRADRLYDIVLLTDWNWPDAEPGRGSAIFLHRWRKPRHPTEGCIAFRPDHLKRVAARLHPGALIEIR